MCPNHFYPKENENPLFPDSYTPISILPTAAKIFEQTIKLIIDEPPIPDFQFANQTDYSVEHALLILETNILPGVNYKTP